MSDRVFIPPTRPHFTTRFTIAQLAAYPVSSIRQQMDLVAQHADARLIVAAPAECAALCLDERQPHAVGGRREQRPQIGQGV